ncbi:MAG: D,D-dipeptide ABC transporter permease, partial [Pseudomonadales bacterium]
MKTPQVTSSPQTVAVSENAHFESGFTLALRQLVRNRAATISALFLILLSVATIFAPLIIPYEPATIALSEKLLSPSFSHWMGTDYFGRDVFTRLIYGARVSLVVGLAVVVFTMAFG